MMCNYRGPPIAITYAYIPVIIEERCVETFRGRSLSLLFREAASGEQRLFIDPRVLF